MIKIDRINIQGYKNIEFANLTLSNFNVIIGTNNSGKSNFIQVISFLNFLINSSVDDVERIFKNGFDGTNFKEIIPFLAQSKIRDAKDFNRLGKMTFQIHFSNSNTNRLFIYSLELKWEADILNSNFKIHNEKLEVKDSNKPGPYINIFNRTLNSVKYGAEFSKMDIIEKIPDHFSVIRLLKIIAGVKDEYKDASDCLNELLQTPIFYFSHIELLKSEKERLNSFNGRVVSFELAEEISNLEESDKWGIFKEAIRDILNIQDANVIRFNNDSKNKKLPVTKFLSFTHNEVYKTIDQFSDGTLLIIALITKILSSKYHLFLIEEPENSTHPKALIDLIAFLKSFSENTQFIITSHSIAILNKTRIEDIVVSTTNESGYSEFYNISSRKDLKNKLRKSSVNFSDELFFNIEDQNEFE